MIFGCLEPPHINNHKSAINNESQFKDREINNRDY